MIRLHPLPLLLLCVTVLMAGLASAAAPASQLLGDGGEPIVPPHDEITPAQEQAMWEEIQRNVESLRSRGALAAQHTTQALAYSFPLRLAPGLSDYAGFRVSAFPDHNPATGQVLDYNGGNRTYDGHRGTDYALWPFAWNKLDAGDAQVIAAAAGTIVAMSNANPADHNCTGSSGGNWNYVALVHTDGRMTIYGHVRYNSLTSKGVGATIVQGEYLATAASSGDSSGPHLHFEVRGGSFASAEWVDPYAGPSSQAGSLWANQPPYVDSAINKLATHVSPPSTPDPCKPSIPNLQDSFTTPDIIYLYIYYRDFQGALPTKLTIYRPDGSIFQSSQYAPGAPAFASAWNYGWAVNAPADAPAGTWRFEATYNGQVYETFFNLNAPLFITVSGPNGGEQWGREVAHPVTWADNLGGAVNIALYHNGLYAATLASNTPSDGEYLWTPDPAQADGTGYTIRVSSVINPAISDGSDAPFSLASPRLIAQDDFVLAPMDTPITIYALNNDSSPPNEALNITALGVPASGTVGIVSSTLVYTPTHGFLGADVFTYTVSTSTETADATVTVRVVAEVFRTHLPLIRR